MPAILERVVVRAGLTRIFDCNRRGARGQEINAQRPPRFGTQRTGGGDTADGGLPGGLKGKLSRRVELTIALIAIVRFVHAHLILVG